MSQLIAPGRRHQGADLGVAGEPHPQDPLPERVPARRSLTIVPLVVALLGGCNAGDSPEASSPNGSQAVGSREFECSEDSPAFPASAFDAAPTAEAEDTALGRAIREVTTSQLPGGGELPDHGWRQLATDATSSVFGHGDPEDLTVLFLDHQSSGEWAFGGTGSCRPLLRLPGSEVLDWAPTASVSSTDRSFAAAVRERECSNASLTEDRLQPAIIDYTETEVIVILTAIPPPPESFTTCDGNPIANVTIELSEALEGRALRDGGTFPDGEPELDE